MAALLRLVSVIASMLVIFGFAGFVADRAREGSDTQLAKLENSQQPVPAAQDERQREQEHGTVREAIDDANDVLLKPFAGIVDSESIWAQRVVAGALALLAYGLGLGLLANVVASDLRLRRRPERSEAG
jgi:hypothetical protein